jgi:rsbT co-antagonist protein RsbR
MGLDLAADFFAYCPQLLFTATRDGAVVRLSASLARLLGPNVQAGTRLTERIHPEDIGAFQAGWAKLTPSGEAVKLKFRLREAQGSYRFVSSEARCSPESGEVHGTVQEIEAQPAPALATLEGEVEILYLLQESLPIGVWMIDQRGVFLRHEGKALTQLGLNQGQFVGLNLFEDFGDLPTVDYVRRAFAGEPLHVFEEYAGITWESWFCPHRDAQGEITSVVGITIDVTAARLVEKELIGKIELIKQQQEVIRALETPIIEVWDKVLTLPMVGVVNSARAAEVMANLLAKVSEKGARFAILDLTGLETVDTSTARHLLLLIQALRLLGAEGIITGIRPDVAQTMVALGLDLKDIVTLSKLRDGLRLCMRRLSAGAA